MVDVIVEDIPESEQTPEIKSPQAAAREDAVSHLALAPRFNLSNPDKQDEAKLAEIWAYAKNIANSDNIPDIVWEVIHLEGVIGSPRLGESRLDKLYRYVRLRRQEAQIKTELKNVTNSPDL